MLCHECGNQLPDDSSFCHKCGTKIAHVDSTSHTPNSAVLKDKPQVTSIAEPSPITDSSPAQAVAQGSTIAANAKDFRTFVDNHVRTNTRFQSADDLLKNSKPLLFIWPCFCIPAVLGLVFGDLVGFLLFAVIFGYTAIFIASGIIRSKYRGKFRGEFDGDIDIEKLIAFLNRHLVQLHPYFHDWGYLSKTGLLSLLENTMANATGEVRICSEFGPKRKSLVTFSIKPKTINAKAGEKLYFVDALKNGFLMDSRAAGFLGHGTLIRTAPILQAAMEYYIKIKVLAEQ